MLFTFNGRKHFIKGMGFCFQSQGPEALNLLQYLSSNDINQPIGTVIHTGMQNSRGGYENDCSVVPLPNNRYI